MEAEITARLETVDALTEPFFVPDAGPADAPPPEAVFADLHTSYDSGQLIIFAGAGISMAAGLPSWPALAQKLRDRLAKEGASAEVVSEIDNLIQRGQLIDALSAMKRALSAIEFNTAIENAVNDTRLPVPDVAKAIAELRLGMLRVFVPRRSETATETLQLTTTGDETSRSVPIESDS